MIRLAISIAGTLFFGRFLMPNDARLGMVVGVTVVILVAVLFIRKDSMTRGAPGKGSPANSASAVVQLPPMVPGLPSVPRPGLYSARTHTVGEGETLTSVAVQYYNDPAKVSMLYQANRDRIMGPDRVPVGTVLVLPER